MRHIARGPVTINHPQRRLANVGELMKNARRNIDSLAGSEPHPLLATAHFAGAFDDKVDFFLLLIMPGNLSAMRFEGDVAHRKISSLNRARPADKILRAPSCRISAAGDLREVCDDHRKDTG